MNRENLVAIWRRYCRHRGATAGLAVISIVVLCAIFAPLLSPGDPLRLAGPPRQWPFQIAQYPLGTDLLGRDILAMLIYGARVSLTIGIVASIVSTLIGLSIGALSGYYGGWINDILMRVTEIFQTIPSFLFALVLVTILGSSLASITVAISVVTWPACARLIRAEFLSLRERDFILSCHAIGMGDLRIIVAQMLPNALPPIIVLSSVTVAIAILTEAALSFLGLGDPNVPSWGSIIGAGRDVLRSDWYIALLPGLAILLTVLSINMVGEGLNDALNPRLKER